MVSCWRTLCRGQSKPMILFIERFEQKYDLGRATPSNA
jgi:hypothetical protein